MPPHFVIAGGGFCGTMVLANLVRQATMPLRITLVEKHEPQAARGVAYSTIDASHLLNVRAFRMGAFSEDAEGFFTFLSSPPGLAAQEEIGVSIGREDFAPRMIYGAYIKEILATALKEAKAKQIEIEWLHGEIIDADVLNTQIRITLVNGNTLTADKLVLACGLLPSKSPRFVEEDARTHPHYISNVWDFFRKTPSLATLPENSTILIIGAGLTMVDTVLGLHARGFNGNMLALSRRGLLPAPHTDSQAQWPAPAFTQEKEEITSVRLLFRTLQTEVKRAAEKNISWHAVIDSLRPYTTTLWQRLSTREKKRFMRHLFTLWNIHRHRMAPEIHAVLHSLQTSGKLRVKAGRVQSIRVQGSDAILAWQPRGKAPTETMVPSYIINCTGLEYNVKHSTHALTNALLARGLITADPLAIGVLRGNDGSAAGNAEGKFYILGNMLVGEKLESVAVPELRKQAADTAHMLLSNA